MKAFLKNLAMAAAGGAAGYGLQHAIPGVPPTMMPMVTTAIGAAVAHWFPQPHVDGDASLG